MEQRCTLSLVRHNPLSERPQIEVMEVMIESPLPGSQEEPESPACVLESLALEPSRKFRVRRMSKEFDRLLQYKSEDDQTNGENQHCENQVTLEKLVLTETSTPSVPSVTDEAYPVGRHQSESFVTMLRERRESLESMEDRRARETSSVRHHANGQQE